MKLTNNYGLPESYVQAVTRNTYRKVGVISVTGLIQPPRLRILVNRHDNEIEQDVSKLNWMFLGSLGHVLFERAEQKSSLVEEALKSEIMGWTVSGRPDELTEDMILRDWKFVNVWAFVLGNKPEWEMQLNYYRWLYSTYGFEIKRLEICAFLLGYQESKALIDPGYPQQSIIRKEIPMWNIVESLGFITTRVALHQLNEKESDDNLTECTPEERWAKPTTYAVKKEGNKTALRVFENKEQAEALAEEKGKGFIIETRPGQSVRCERFCLAAPFCNQYKQMKGE